MNRHSYIATDGRWYLIQPFTGFSKKNIQFCMVFSAIATMYLGDYMYATSTKCYVSQAQLTNEIIK